MHVLPNRGGYFPVLSKDRALKVLGKLIAARGGLHKPHAVKLGVGVDDLAPAVNSDYEKDSRLFPKL
jgi:hypothetical protein